MVMSRFLRFALLADAGATAAMALLLVAGASALAPLFGLPHALLSAVGLFLIPYAAVVGWLGTRPVIARWLVWTVVAGNAAWAATSLVLLASGWIEPTALGTAFVIAQALLTTVFAEMQFVGARRVAKSARVALSI